MDLFLGLFRVTSFKIRPSAHRSLSAPVPLGVHKAALELFNGPVIFLGLLNELLKFRVRVEKRLDKSVPTSEVGHRGSTARTSPTRGLGLICSHDLFCRLSGCVGRRLSG